MNAVATRVPRWSEAAISRLRDARSCPLCTYMLEGQRCSRCGADYRGAIGSELWDASQAAVAALEARQSVLDRVELRPIEAPVAPAMDTGAASAPSAVPDDLSGPPRSSATVQSVLAVAGAGLVAVAAIVFTFFNPDLTDSLLRGVLVGGVTVVFLVGATALARRGLQFSAEAVGALGMVFVGLDIHALTALAPTDPWGVAAVATLVAASAMVFVALRVRVRVWLWVSLVALAFVPAMIGYAAGSTVLGHLGTAAAAFALLAAADAFARRFGAPLRGERVTLTIVELLAIAVALIQAGPLSQTRQDELWPELCATLAATAVLALFSTRHPAARLWSFLAGAFGVATIAVLPIALAPRVLEGEWTMTIIPAAAVVGATVWGVLLPIPSGARRGLLIGGSLTIVAMVAAVPTAYAVLLCADALLFRGGGIGRAWESAAAVVLALASLAAGLGLLSFLRERLHPVVAEPDRAAPLGTRWVGRLALWFAALAALTLLTVPGIAVAGRVAIGLALGAAASLAVAFLPRLRDASAGVRVPIIAGAHLLVALAAILSWREPGLGVTAGVAVVAAIAALARALPRRVRFLHVGVGYAYALVVFATALSERGVAGAALVCLTTSAGAVVAIAATFLPGVGANAWRAILAVTSVPFLIGVGQVVFERSGWTALSTGLIFLLALALVVTKREGLGMPLRVMAAGVLVPSLAVVVVCLGAELLAASGSPVVLPVIALIVALVLPSGPLIGAALVPRIGQRDAALARIAIEASTLLTAGIAVLLALVREAAGLSTTLIVLVLLAIGGAATSMWGGRRYGWWLAGAASTGALWCAWGIVGIDVIEPYLLPPALGAALVGAILTARGARGLPLYAAGLFAAAVPLLVLVAVVGPLNRAIGLVAASWVILALGELLGRGGGERADRLRSLRPITFAAAIVAGAAGPVAGVRLGSGLDEWAGGASLVVVCLLIGFAAAIPAALAARALRAEAPPGSRVALTRWLYASSFAYVAVAAWPAIERDWFAIWTMWGLMVGLLVSLVASAARGLRGKTGLPPVWYLFGLAFVTAVVAWSPRDLRVEWFSLPLGLGLLIAGVLAMRVDPRRDGDIAGRGPAGGSWNAWPTGWSGSWALLGPGLVVTLSASVAATFTDPLTWRAILVIVLALAAILVGASRRLAAPFLIGIVVLPVENAIAFMVQIGRGIQSMPWWITLAVVGAVLLIIAVTYERRAGEERGIAARLRDLG